MKLLIYWYSNDTLRNAKFLERELLEKPHEPHAYYIAWMTRDAIWKNYAVRSVSKEAFEEELRNPPAFTREET